MSRTLDYGLAIQSSPTIEQASAEGTFAAIPNVAQPFDPPLWIPTAHATRLDLYGRTSAGAANTVALVLRVTTRGGRLTKDFPFPLPTAGEAHGFVFGPTLSVVTPNFAIGDVAELLILNNSGVVVDCRAAIKAV